MAEKATEVKLEQHGWKRCIIPLSLEDVDSQLPTWRDLQVLRPPEKYGTRTLQLPYEALRANQFPAFQLGEQLDEGTYGRILKAQRAVYQAEDPTHPTLLTRIEPFMEIVCKVNDIPLLEEKEREEMSEEDQELWYTEEVQAILHEASLHALAYHILSAHGYTHVIPTLYEVYALSSHRTLTRASDISGILLGMEFIPGETLHSYFAKHFEETTLPRKREQNDRLLMDVLIQLAIYLDILQTDLRFNHRDLKINNVLRRTHSTPYHRALSHPALTRPWVAFHDLVIIDFGFSCVACDDTPKSLIQAGSWFKPHHDCLKRGRDIALFLYCLQSFYPLESRISPPLLQVLRDAMTITIQGREYCLLMTQLDRHGNPQPPRKSSSDPHRVTETPIHFGDGIYKLLRRDTLDVAGCAPAALLFALDMLRSAGAAQN